MSSAYSHPYAPVRALTCVCNQSRTWLLGLLALVLAFAHARAAFGITSTEVAAFKAQLEATPTDAGNYQSRLATAQQVQDALAARGDDISAYAIVFGARGSQEQQAGDWAAFYGTLHRYALALCRHYLDGGLALATPTNTAAAHPHVLFDANELSRLRGASDAGHAALRDVIAFSVSQFGSQSPKSYAELKDMGEVEDPWRIYGNNLVELAFQYLLTRSATDRTNAKRWLLDVLAYDHWGAGDATDHDLAAAHLLFGTALAYDWLYADLTEAERETVRRKLGNQAALIHAYAMGFKACWWEKTWTQNHNAINNAALALAGYAVRGEVEEAEEWIAQGRANAESVLAALNAIGDGSYHEGYSYWSYLMSFLLVHLDAIQQNDGVDLVSSSPWMRETLFFRLYGQYPDFTSVVTFADGGTKDYHGPEHILRRLDAAFRTGYGEWLAQRLIEANGGTHYERRAWAPFEYLWYDSAVAAKAPTDLPTSRLFADVDLAIMRSGWGAQDTVVMLKSGSPEGRTRFTAYVNKSADAGMLNAGHNHPNQNTVSLFAYGAPLLMEPGYPSPKKTSHHNTIAVARHGQLGEGKEWFDIAAVLAEQGVGRISSFYALPSYSYVSGEAGAAYPDALGVQRYGRHLLFLKPNLLVLVDQVNLQSPAEVHLILRRYFTPFASQGNSIAAQSANGATLWANVLAPAALTVLKGTEAAAPGAPPFYYATGAASTQAASNRFVTVITARPDSSAAASGTLGVNGADAVKLEVRDGDAIYDVGLALATGSATAANFGLAGTLGVVRSDRAGNVLEYVLGGGTALSDPDIGRDYVRSSGSSVTLQVRLAAKTAYLDGPPAAAQVTVYAPGVTSVVRNGTPVPFTQQGDMVTVDLDGASQGTSPTDGTTDSTTTTVKSGSTLPTTTTTDTTGTSTQTNTTTDGDQTAQPVPGGGEFADEEMSGTVAEEEEQLSELDRFLRRWEEYQERRQRGR